MVMLSSQESNFLDKLDIIGSSLVYWVVSSFPSWLAMKFRNSLGFISVINTWETLIRYSTGEVYENMLSIY